jgi:hypothetical protein
MWLYMCKTVAEIKIRIKFGEHEFEAEGSEETVDRHLTFFKLLIARAPNALAAPDTPADEPLPLEKIVRIDKGVVSLKVNTKPDDAILVLLLGLSELCQRNIISGSQIMAGLRASGLRVRRADVLLKRHASSGRIIAIGKHRSTRYQFSKHGRERAQQIAVDLISRLPPETESLAQPH